MNAARGPRVPGVRVGVCDICAREAVSKSSSRWRPEGARRTSSAPRRAPCSGNSPPAACCAAASTLFSTVARGPPRGSAVKPASSASPRSANPPAAAPTPRAGMPRDNVARTRFVDCLEVKESTVGQGSRVDGGEGAVGKESSERQGSARFSTAPVCAHVLCGVFACFV